MLRALCFPPRLPFTAPAMPLQGNECPRCTKSSLHGGLCYRRRPTTRRKRPFTLVPSKVPPTGQFARCWSWGAVAATTRRISNVGLRWCSCEPSAGMRAVSLALNPDCEHVAGDMRSVRLGRQFDAVFVHDAVCYMTTESDLQLAIETAFVHCQPGGVALFAPDFVRDTFRPGTDHGGSDDGRARPAISGVGMGSRSLGHNLHRRLRLSVARA